MITSLQNTQVKKWKKLHARKYRDRMQKFLIEGFHLVEEADKSDWEMETIIVQNGTTIPDWINESKVTAVNDRVFSEITQTDTPQGIAAVVYMKEVVPKTDEYILLTDAIQDPGNLGTIIRTADAAGFSKIIVGSGTVDPFNDKAIRASQGSIFHVSLEKRDLIEAIQELKKSNYTVWASALDEAADYSELTVDGKAALIVGNEGAGISEAVLKEAGQKVKIPIFGEAESLNVSVAAGILMYKMRN